MVYKDKTWCSAKCKADGACGRKLSEDDLKTIKDEDWLVSYSDFSPLCELYVPEGDNEKD